MKYNDESDSDEEGSDGDDEETADREGAGSEAGSGSDAEDEGKDELEDEGLEGGTKMPSFQDYFDANGRTSDNRLSSLPLLDHKEYIRAIRAAPAKHEAEIRQGFELHSRSFPEWYFQLGQGFNLCFYGFGSKRKLLTAFVEAHLSAHPLIVVNGFFPRTSVKAVVAQIITQIIQPIEGTKGSVPSQINDALAVVSDFFSDDTRRRDLRLFIVVHNIDGDQLRNVQAQNALCHLAAVPNVSLICSIDHINAPLLWDAARMDRLSFLWHDVSTFEPYDVETSMAEDSGLVSLVRGDGNRTLTGMKHVMRSLPANARRVFRVLADHQLAAVAGQGGADSGGGEGAKGSKRAANKQAKQGLGAAEGLPLQIYRRKCEEQFIPGIGSDVTFRAQLREFTDHKLMEQVVTAENGEVVFIPMETQILRDLLVVMNDL
jgi:origin recognition complex subunit 2